MGWQSSSFEDGRKLTPEQTREFTPLISWRGVVLPDGRRALRRIGPTESATPSAAPASSWRAVLLADGCRVLRRMRERPASPAPTPRADDAPVLEAGPAPAAPRRASCAAAATARPFRPLAIRCERCGARVELNDREAAALCATCRPLVLDAITVYDRTNGIGAIPPNLLRRYGTDLAIAA